MKLQGEEGMIKKALLSIENVTDVSINKGKREEGKVYLTVYSSSTAIICFGSSPTVGSSKIKTSGFPISAAAKPTRCLKPLERFLIKRFFISVGQTR